MHDGAEGLAQPIYIGFSPAPDPTPEPTPGASTDILPMIIGSMGIATVAVTACALTAKNRCHRHEPPSPRRDRGRQDRGNDGGRPDLEMGGVRSGQAAGEHEPLIGADGRLTATGRTALQTLQAAQASQAAGELPSSVLPATVRLDDDADNLSS